MKYSHSTALAVALAMPLLAFGQPSASTPPYQSAFADYKPYQDVPAGNWRALNDAVRDAGGQMAPGMAMPPASAAAPVAASAPAKATSNAPMKGMDHMMPGGMK
jgi:hypothetical protein